jgi:hypothetical protein
MQASRDEHGGQKAGHCPCCDQPIPTARLDEITKRSEASQAAQDRLNAATERMKAQLEELHHRLQERKGRPPKPPVPGERISLGLKVTAAIKSRLDQAARESGRTQSQEAEIRLERSFEREDLLSEALTLAYGRKVAGILLAVAYVMDAASRLTERNTWNPFRKDWTDDPERFDHAVQAATALLYAVRPPGEIPDRSSERSSDRRDPGTWLVGELLLALRDDNSEFPAEVATEVKQMLGPLAQRMTENAAARVGDRSKLRLPVSGEGALNKARITRGRLRK